MRILFTGASSLSGSWMVRMLGEAGHEVVAALARSPSQYEGLRRCRLEWLAQWCRVEPDAPFGSARFLQLFDTSPGFEVLCHHGAQMANYLSPEFDVAAAVANNTHEARAVLERFRNRGGRSFVVTGSVFEPDEGRGTAPLGAVRPYGLAKGLSWQVLRYHAESLALPLGKFVMPRVFGPYEDPRFPSYLMNMWSTGKIAEVKEPAYVRDNIHVDLLAQVYRNFVEEAAAGPMAFARCNPSGYVEPQGDFAQRYAREMQGRLGWDCAVKLHVQTEFTETLMRANTEPAASLIPEWNEARAWDRVANYYDSSKAGK
jgi:nucleoside-diphosphate-sugar epimerase